MGIEGLLTRTAMIFAVTGSTVSASGETRKTYASTGVPALCDIQPSNAGLRRLELGEEVAGDYKGFFLPDAVLHEGYKVVDADGTEYLVLKANNIRGDHIEASLHRGLW